MKCFFVFVGFFVFIIFPFLGAQEIVPSLEWDTDFVLLNGEDREGSSLDWDIDSVFDVPAEEDSAETEKNGTDLPLKTNTLPVSAAPANTKSIMSEIKQRGITFDASFEFLEGVASGWNETLWIKEQSEDENPLIHTPVVKMRADFGIDAQVSEFFRVNTAFYFEIPKFKITLNNFYADYNIYNAVFFRAGKYTHAWGISPNFTFANLLARVPKDGPEGDSFVFKTDVPLGIGGIQLLTQTRADLINSDKLRWEEFGFGGKYNMALPRADFDLGVFYQENMPFRGFISVKTTFGNTELYNEWLAAVDLDKREERSNAVNFGFVQTLFDSKFEVNGEVFYNAEGNAYWYQPETNLETARVSPFMEGLNLALNLAYKFSGKSNLRLFVQTLYAPGEESARLIPGLRLSPFPNAEISLAVPMALGSETGYYYLNTPDPRPNPKQRPFFVVLLFSLKGSVRSGYYY